MTRKSVPSPRVMLLALLAFSSPLMMTPSQAQIAPAPDASIRLILSRYRQLLLEKAPTDAANMKKWLDTLDAQGQWPDIDYSDKQPAAWKTSDHLVRLKALSRALADPAAPLSRDARLPGAISRALDHWLAKRYKNANWWHNDIGVPMLMRDILILLGDHLQGAQRSGALEVLNQYGRPQSGGGANTIWEAELGLEYGALTNDAALIDGYSQMIAKEIKASNTEGLQSDWSFHQHRARLQQFHYGGAFLVDGARLGWQLSGTPWALPSEKLRLLCNYVLNGSQWMARGIYTVPGTLDRSVSRVGALKSGDMRTALRQLRDAVPARAAELDAVLARQEGKAHRSSVSVLFRAPISRLTHSRLPTAFIDQKFYRSFLRLRLHLHFANAICPQRI